MCAFVCLCVSLMRSVFGGFCVSVSVCLFACVCLRACVLLCVPVAVCVFVLFLCCVVSVFDCVCSVHPVCVLCVCD